MTRLRDLTVTVAATLVIGLTWSIPVLTWNPPTALAAPTQGPKQYTAPPSRADCQIWQYWRNRGAGTYNYYGSIWILPDGNIVRSITPNECNEIYGTPVK